MAEEEFNVEDCCCEDPYEAGHKLRLCGQAICLRLLGLIPKPAIVAFKVEDETELPT